MKRNMILIVIISAIVTIISILIYCIFNFEIFKSLSITFGVIFYHFAIRLFIGNLIAGVKKNNWDYDRKWFRQKHFESILYRHLKIKNWKSNIPTYNPNEFDIKNHSIEYVTSATCQAEVVHEVNIVASFVPILLSIWFDPDIIFWITSILAAFYDSIFVILQRYNRPRLIRILNSKVK